MFSLARRIPVLSFGRRQPFTFPIAVARSAATLTDDAQLFLTTFVGGLLFMTVYLA